MTESQVSENKHKSLERILGMGTGADIDIALVEFKEVFTSESNIKLSMKRKELPFFPNILQIYDTFEDLLGVFLPLTKKGWKTAYNKHHIPGKFKGALEAYSGYVYIRKDNLAYGAAGFVYPQKDHIIVEGTLFGNKNEELPKIYNNLIEMLSNTYEIKKHKSEQYSWNRNYLETQIKK